MSVPERCPNCGSRQINLEAGEATYSCGGSRSEHLEVVTNECRSRQFAGQRDQIDNLKARIGELEIGFKRYERVRRMNPREFADLYERCIRDDIHFDSAIDCLIATGQ